MQSAECTGKIRILNDNHECVKEYDINCTTKKGYATECLDIDFELGSVDEVFYVECTVESNGRTDKNTYMFFITDDSKPYASQKAVIDFSEKYLKENN